MNKLNWLIRDDPVGNGTSKRLVLIVTTIAPFILTFMSSAVNIALPVLGKELSLHANMQGWIATSCLLSWAAFLVPFGRIADIYGRKRIFACGIGIFTLSSLLSGLANSATMLIAWRVLQGIGGAMVTATAAALLITAFSADERGKVLGINIAAAYLGLSLGPVLGGGPHATTWLEEHLFRKCAPGIAGYRCRFMEIRR